MRILFINQFFPPEIEPSATKVHEVGRELVRLDHQVTVITGFPNYPTGVIPPEYRGKLVQTEEWDGIRVLRTALLPVSTSRFLLRTLSHLSFLISSSLRSLGSGPCDIVICSSPPLEIALAGIFISRLKRKPFVLEIRDLWPDDAIHLGLLKGRVPIAIAKWIEHLAYRRASMLVPVSPGFVPYLLREGVPEWKIRVIVNGSDVNVFRPDGAQSAMGRHFPDGDFVVIYAGTHGLQHHLETVLETACLLREHQEIGFVLAGDGNEKTKLLEKQRQLGLTNVQLLPTQPREKIAALIGGADVCLVHTADMMINTRNIPAKLFDYMAAGRPVVVAARGQARSLVEQAQAGIAVSPEDPHGMAEAIVQLCNDSGLRAQLGVNGRKYAVEHFSRQIIAQQYTHLLKEVLCATP